MWNVDQENHGNGKQKNSVRKEILVVFRHDENKRAKQTPTSAPPSELLDRKGWQKYFEKKESQRPESIWEIISTDAQRLHQR